MLRFLCGLFVPPTLWMVCWLAYSLPHKAEDSVHAVAYLSAGFFWACIVIGLFMLAAWNRGDNHG
jgi:hypothetical protein